MGSLVLSNLRGWGVRWEFLSCPIWKMGVQWKVLSNFGGSVVSNLWDSCLVQFGWWGLGGGARGLVLSNLGEGRGGRNLVPPNFVHGITNHIVALSVCTTMKNDKK